MSDDNSLQSRLLQLVADQLRQPLDKVTAEAHLIDDLDADSLDIVDLTIAVEEEFSTDDNQIEIPEEDAAEIRSVQDLLNYLANAGIRITMTLSRITASVGGALSPTTSGLASEAIRLPAGQRALNRETTGPTALIVAEGEVSIGTLDDNATLQSR